MTRWTSFAIIGLFCAVGWGDDKADRAVDAVLSLEAREGIANRGDQLSGVMDAPRARWAAGYINEADGWHPFDATATRLDDDPNWQEYQRRRGIQPLTAQQHLELADWCAAHGLKDQQRAHLWGALFLNAKQPAIWRKLGYHEVNGEWVTDQDEVIQKQKQKKTERDHRAWLNRVQSLQKRFSDPSPGAQANAREQLLAIKDVKALPAMEAVMAPTSQESALRFVNWASSINCIETTMALVRQSVISPWEPVRQTAAEGLKSRRLDHYAPALMDSLEMPAETSVVIGTDRSQHSRPFLFLSIHRELRNSIFDGMYRDDLGGYVLDFGITPYGQIRSVTVVTPSQRGINDLTRVAENNAESIRTVQAKAHAANREWNDRVAAVLTRAADAPARTSAKEWWEWWGVFAAVDVPNDYEKPYFNQRYVTPPVVTSHLTHSCLPAGTPIITEAGPKPIETIRIGDRVLSKDITTGELAYRPVLQTTVRKPQPLKMLHLENETISATLGHYFWVSGQGWRMTRELKPGDRLHGVEGSIELTSVTTGEVAAVYNLVVERANTYFVGNSHILSHDVTPPSPTNIIVPGLAAR